MENYCKIDMAGVVTYQPDIRELKNNLLVCNFNLKVEFGKGNKKRSTSFRCTAWNELGRYIYQNVSTNDNIVVKGSIENKRYKETVKTIEGEDVVWRDWWQVTVYECIIDGKQVKEKKKEPVSEPEREVAPEANDDIPF